jgi:circadian clock protein KaiC
MPTGSRHAAGGLPQTGRSGRGGGYDQEVERISSGVSLLDDALGSGLWPGASTLVAGPSGSGKTLIGLHFVFAGARSGQPGLIASFQENQRSSNGSFGDSDGH